MDDENRFVHRKVVLILGIALIGSLLVVSIPLAVKTFGVWWLFAPLVVTFILSGVAIRLRYDWPGDHRAFWLVSPDERFQQGHVLVQCALARPTYDDPAIRRSGGRVFALRQQNAPTCSFCR